MYDIIAQVIGILGTCAAILAFQCKKNTHMFLAQALSGLLFTVNFIMLGAYGGGLLNFVNVIRGVALVYIPDKHRKLVCLGSILLYGLVTVITYEGYMSIIILVAQIVGTITMMINSGKIIRLTHLCVVGPLWMYHNYACGSIGGVLCEVFNITSIIVSIIRHGINGFSK